MGFSVSPNAFECVRLATGLFCINQRKSGCRLPSPKFRQIKLAIGRTSHHTQTHNSHPSREPETISKLASE